MTTKSKEETIKENRMKIMFSQGFSFYKSLDEKVEPLNPKGLAKFLKDNELVILSSLYKAISNDSLNIVIFYDLYTRLRVVNKEFDFRPTGYAKDFGITLDVAARLIKLLKDMGYNVDKNKILYFDKEDYMTFLEYKKHIEECKTLRKMTFDFDKSPKPKYFKSVLDFNIKDEEFMIEKYKGMNINADNKEENKIQSILDKLNIKYERQTIFNIDGKSYIADFYIPKNNVIIEVDGDYHNKYDQQIKDFCRDKHFSSRGILTLRVSASTPYSLSQAEMQIKNILSTVNVNLPKDLCFAERELMEDEWSNSDKHKKIVNFVLDRSKRATSSTYETTKFLLDNGVRYLTTTSLANISLDLIDNGFEIFIIKGAKKLQLKEGMVLSEDRKSVV